MSKAMNARAQAARCITAVIGEGESLTTALELSREVVAPRDVGLLYEMCFGVLRHYFRLEALAKQLFSKPLKARDKDILALVMVGLYQLIYMKVPDHAALNETVAATRSLSKQWARGLVNALLRRYLRESEDLLQKVENTPEVQAELPGWLAGCLQQAWPDDWSRIVAALQQHPPMSLRVNLARQSRDDYLAQLQEAGMAAHSIAATPAGVQLEQPVGIEGLPGFADGEVSVQDGAAQLCTTLLDLEAGQRVLDACAAPGGKTAALLEAAQAAGHAIEMLAVDNNEQRLERVTDNLARLGLQAGVACFDVADSEAFGSVEPFDRILLDVPCSATGVIRRHPDIKLLRRETDIAALVQTQAQILASCWQQLKPGGRLLYATCSILPEENTQQVAAFLAAHDDARELAIEADWGRPQPHGRQLLPGDAGMDGFYYALLEKTA